MTNQVIGSAYVATKTPSEHDDWEIDWSTRGLGSDTIVASVWSVDAASGGSASDLTTSTPSPTIGNPATNTTVWLSGGIAGASYIVTNSVTTSGTRVLTESFLVDCVPYRLISN
jgi:hypothetical protein